MPLQSSTQKKTRRRSPRKVGNRTLDQILARQEELLKELEEIEVELSKANIASDRTRKFLQQKYPSAPAVAYQAPRQSQQNWTQNAQPMEFGEDTGSSMVSPLDPEQQIAQLHNNISQQVDQLRHKQPTPEGSPF